MRQEQIGFPGFQEEVRRSIGPLLDGAFAFRDIGQELLSKRCAGELAAVVREIARSVANSMESVLILVSNGCPDDAFRIARSMFESAVTVHYLDSHPELVRDYVDFLWVKRKLYHEDRLKYAPGQAERMDPRQLERMNSEYERVKSRFMDRNGKVRNSWCRITFRAMAEEVKAAPIYGGMYGFTSSMTHTDMLGLHSASAGGDGVIPVPSLPNIPLVLQMAIVSYAMTLTAISKIASSKLDGRLEQAFAQFKKVCADLLPIS